MSTKIFTSFFTTNGVPQPNAFPTISIWRVDHLSNESVVVGDSMTDCGGGWYRYNFVNYNKNASYVFTIDGGGSFNDADRYKFGGTEGYTEEIADSVWSQQLTDHMSTGSMGEAVGIIKATEATIYTLISTLLKYERNRTRIDSTNAQLIIYDDDCTTVLTTFNLRDFNGMPSVREVCERVPTTCPSTP